MRDLQPAIELLRDIASQPRPTGGEANARARERCARELRDLGFDVTEQRFEFSEFPGRFGMPLFGAVAAFAVGLTGMLALSNDAKGALIVMLASAISLIAAGIWLTRYGVLRVPVMRAQGVNLQAVPPGRTPAIWLAAHVDTKSQPIPSLVRALGIVLEIFGFAVVFVLAVLCVAGIDPHVMFWYFGAGVTLVGAIPVVLSTVGSRSPGALDNASGVATVMEAARELGSNGGVGVLITDAEEFGLAGARAWRPLATSTILNCDGVDDAGDVQVMFTGTRPATLSAAIARASTRSGVPHTIGRMLPGILTDSVAFSAAGTESVTFSRGTWRSLLRVHSRRDDLEHLDGTGIADVARLMAFTAQELSKS